MNEKRRNLPGRSESGVIAFYLGLLAAVVIALLADGLIRIGALAVLGLFAAYFLVGDFFLALTDERITKKFPHDNRNSDVGRTVRVLEDFVAGSGTSKGSVTLAGETWKARSLDDTAHSAGEKLIVVDVEGLVLVVASPERKSRHG